MIVGRYHSLSAEKEFRACSERKDPNGEIMAVDPAFIKWKVQFHPESIMTSAECI